MSTTADACWAGPLNSEERAELAAMLDRWCWKFDAAAGCDLLQIGIALRCSYAATEMAMLYRDAMRCSPLATAPPPRTIPAPTPSGWPAPSAPTRKADR